MPGLPFVSFVNSGAEANEKALGLCRQRARSERQRKVLAFEGSFHGRTLLALHATYRILREIMNSSLVSPSSNAVA